MKASCTAREKFWQKAVEGLSRADERHGKALARAGGDQAEAARLLWAQSHHNETLRNDLVKAACVMLACPGYSGAPAAAPPGAPRHAPGA